MSKYTTEGNVITIDLEDGKPAIVCDVSKLTAEVQQAGMLFGFRTVLRNTTAGKMDEPEKARKAMEERLALFTSGKWESETAKGASVELTDDERNKIIADVIVLAKKAKGDTRAPGDILKAFNALPEEQRKAAVGSLQKMIDKKIKDALRQKRLMSKSAENAAMSF